MKKILAVVIFAVLAVLLMASSVQTVTEITAVNLGKIESIETPSPFTYMLGIKMNKIDAVLVNYTSTPCSQTSCVSTILVYMQSGDSYILDHTSIYFSLVLNEYTGIGPGVFPGITFANYPDYLIVHSITGKTYSIPQNSPQYDDLLAEYFGQ